MKMSNTCQEEDIKDSVDSECHRTVVTPKRGNNCSPVIQVTWRSRAGVGRGLRGCHRTPVRVSGSGSSSSGSSSSSSSSTGEHVCSVFSHAGSTPQWYIRSPRVQQLIDSVGCSNIVLETDLKSMRLGRNDSTPLTANQTPKKTGTESRTFNPFELDLVDTMHLSSFSPSVFSKVVTPSKDGQQDNGCNFSWGIDNVAVLYPSEFDDVPTEASPFPKFDQEVEDKLQHAINRFFHTACVPSPWSDSNNHSENSQREISNCTVEREVSSMGPTLKTKRDASCQTTLALPNNFDLGLVLANYYTYNESQAQETSRSEDEVDAKEVLSTSSLRRKLFANDENPSSPPVSSSAELAQIPTERTVSPMANESILSDNLPQTPFQDQCASSPLSEITGRHQRASLTPPTINSPTVSPIRILVRQMDEIDEEESDADMSFMSTCHMESMIECHERLDTSQSSNSISYLQQITEEDQHMGHKSRASIFPVLEPVDEDMEQLIENDPDFKTSFMETTPDNSCYSQPGSHFVTAENHDTGYQTQTNALQITSSSSSDNATSFSTSIQAPLLWHKRTMLKCGVNSFNPQTVTENAKQTILTNEMGLENTTQMIQNSENVGSPLVASTPSRSQLPMF